MPTDKEMVEDLREPTSDSAQLDAMVRCEQCVEKNLKRSDVKEYRATTPEGDQANLTLCKPCVNYLRHEENVRLKLIST